MPVIVQRLGCYTTFICTGVFKINAHPHCLTWLLVTPAPPISMLPWRPYRECESIQNKRPFSGVASPAGFAKTLISGEAGGSDKAVWFNADGRLF